MIKEIMTAETKETRGKTRVTVWWILIGAAGVLLVALCLPPGAPSQPLTTQILDEENEVISVVFEENRQPVSLSEVPVFLRQAFLSVEDHRFYSHNGISPTSLLRAAYHNLFIRRGTQGGSTITQQLVKNGYLSAERSLLRKIKEIFLAWKMELHYSKDAIFEMYLNQIYFGHGAYGLKTAAQTYFGRPLSELNRAEMALLAGVTKGPALYSPYLHPEAARRRIKVVLERMRIVGYLSSAEVNEVLGEPLRLPGPPRLPRQALYFLDYVLEETAKILRVPKDQIQSMGLRIETTLSLPMQKAAEESFQKRLIPLQRNLQPQGALIAVNPRTGEIKALVGGTDYFQTPFNRAINARRQPGSAFKPFVYLAALEAGYTLASTIPCRPLALETPSGEYRPTDYGLKAYHNRELTLREAIAESCNIVAVTLHHRLNTTPTIEMARRLGIKSHLPANPSLALGTAEVTPLELIEAYLPIANGGRAVTPWAIKRIYNGAGKLIWQRKDRSRQVLDPRLSFIITSALQDTLRPGGTAGEAGRNLKFTAAGKTGTSQDNRDAWFVGYTPDLAAVVYIGHDRNQPLPGSGGQLAAPVWVNFINQALAGRPDRKFLIPEGLVTRTICRESGLLATPGCPERSEYFRVGHEPTMYCSRHRLLKLRVCATSGLLPGPHCRETVEREFLWGRQPTASCHICRAPQTLWELIFGRLFPSTKNN